MGRLVKVVPILIRKRSGSSLMHQQRLTNIGQISDVAVGPLVNFSYGCLSRWVAILATDIGPLFARYSSIRRVDLNIIL